jgi:hypothetical protein
VECHSGKLSGNVIYETFKAFRQRVPYVVRDSVQGVPNFSTSAEARLNAPKILSTILS